MWCTAVSRRWPAASAGCSSAGGRRRLARRRAAAPPRRAADARRDAELEGIGRRRLSPVVARRRDSGSVPPPAPPAVRPPRPRRPLLRRAPSRPRRRVAAVVPARRRPRPTFLPCGGVRARFASPVPALAPTRPRPGRPAPTVDLVGAVAARRRRRCARRVRRAPSRRACASTPRPRAARGCAPGWRVGGPRQRRVVAAVAGAGHLDAAPKASSPPCSGSSLGAMITRSGHPSRRSPARPRPAVAEDDLGTCGWSRGASATREQRAGRGDRRDERAERHRAAHQPGRRPRRAARAACPRQ